MTCLFIAEAVVALAACRRRAVADASPVAASQDAEPGAEPRTAAAVDLTTRDAREFDEAPAEAPRWCAVALQPVDARAIDRRGHVIALRDAMLRDETANSAPVALPRSDPPCPIHHDRLAFRRDGSAFAVAHGRVYVRASERDPWVVTPMCTDLDGDPWARRVPGGWAVVARRFVGRDPALLLTEDRLGRTGWYAITAMDPTMSAALLEADGSLIALTAGGHTIFVDRERHVAGAVIATGDALFSSLTRTPAGVAVARDVDPATRDVVVGVNVQQPFASNRFARPEGPHTARVFVLDLGQLLATTNRGVEWAPQHGAFVEVARWPVATPDASSDIDAGEHTAMGWLDDGAPAVVARAAIIAERCVSLAPTPQWRTSERALNSHSSAQ